MNIVPDYHEDEPNKLNWGKFILVGKTISAVQIHQQRFAEYDSHDYLHRPIIEALINNSPVMPTDVGGACLISWS